ncbi:cation:proton antiporter [Cellulomonas marina]|uniref:Na+/H+ antiporter n=1 Tax=Cellulomonas marina TaxID=988821 RepID=A0A1I1ASS0_9CELL|nr:sodium:proton antiporter [Cellulomonas marina]GIG30268.1 hypothetical protein Cma02nite_28680 [Cellulomonas marina]SFB40937.1 Na+/H+ antiporter [Cellulomonas marina]
MHHVEVFLLAAGAVVVAAACRRRGWSAPLVVLAVALLVSFVPGVPRYEVDPELLLEFVLPPLLYSAAQASSYRDFRRSLSSITRLGVGLVVVTAFAVAAVVTALVPQLPFAAALVLGAVVAPPDAVAAAAVGRRLGLPRRVMTLLSGESLINDATSLTLYKVALAGVATGAWALGDAAGTFALAVVAGVGVGLALGWLLHRARLRLDDPVVASAFGLLTPFAAYWSAEAVGGSGVLAVVAAGLYLGHQSPRAGYATRLYQGPLWSTVDLLLEAFTFALIGMQLPWLVRDLVASDQGLGHGVLVSAATAATVVLVRPLYVYATRRFDDLRLPGSHRPPGDALTRRESAVVSWAGMRGVVTLAAAAAIPQTIDDADFPERATLQLAAYAVAIGTLLLQGLTLPAVIRRLRVGSEREERADAAQEAAARRAAQEAVEQVLADQRPVWRQALGRERADVALDRISAAWQRRTTAAAQVLDPHTDDEDEDVVVAALPVPAGAASPEPTAAQGPGDEHPRDEQARDEQARDEHARDQDALADDHDPAPARHLDATAAADARAAAEAAEAAVASAGGPTGEGGSGPDPFAEEAEPLEAPGRSSRRPATDGGGDGDSDDLTADEHGDERGDEHGDEHGDGHGHGDGDGDGGDDRGRPDDDRRAGAGSGAARLARLRRPGTRSSGASPSTREQSLRVQDLRRRLVAAQRAVLVRRRDRGELDEEVMRRMLRELDLEDEAMSASWVERVRP